MKQNFVKLFMLLLANYCSFEVYCQKSPFLSYFSIGASALPSGDIDKANNYIDKSWILNTKIEVKFFKGVHVGVNRMHYFGNINGVRSPYLYLDQPYVGYDFYKSKKQGFRFFGLANFSAGNFCGCEKEEPYLKKGKKYWGWGLGIDQRLWRSFFLEVSFASVNHFKLPAPGMSRSYSLNVFLGIVYKQRLFEK